MGIDITYLLRADAGTFHRELDCSYEGAALGVRFGYVVGIGCHSISDELGIDRGIPCKGVFQSLQNEYSRRLCHDESISLGVKGATGPLGVLISCGHGPEGDESTENIRRNTGIHSSGDYNVLRSLEDLAIGIDNGVSAGGTGR